MTSTERRNYFRVNSELKLKYLSVSAHTVESSLPEDLFPEDHQSAQLIQELQRLDHDIQPHLHTLSELNRTLGECLKLLNRKMDLVARHSAAALSNLNISNQNSAEDNTQAIVHVNVSEGGIAFPSDTPYKAGDYLGLRLQFLNDYAALTTFAIVRRCEPGIDNQPYTIACEFHQLSQKAQEMLRRQVMQEQLKAIREQKHTTQHPL